MNKKDLEAALIDALYKLNEAKFINLKMKDAMERFTRRCEEGSIKSVRTYNEFKDILEYIKE